MLFLIAAFIRRGVKTVFTLLLFSSAPLVLASNDALVQPKVLVSARSSGTPEVRDQVLAARRFGSFWNTGDESLARAALAPDFTDRTLPAGRPQGIEGPIGASKFMRTAIPDLSCEIEQMIVAGDRVVVHLRFRGRFSGRFKDTQGKGQVVSFIATDIYRVVKGRISDNWHIEDNQALMQQLGITGG